MAWSDHAEDVVHFVPCDPDGGHHVVRWQHGRIVIEDHDAEGEAVLAALGGTPPACLDILRLWDAAVADGGFMDEWADRLTPTWHRTQWLKIAVARIQNERVQDFLYGLPIGRAEVMGEVLATFPPPLQDRAAASSVVHHLEAGAGLGGLRESVERAIRLRARSAFVESLAGMPEAGVAPLVRFRCRVADGPVSVSGELHGHGSWCDITVNHRWLADVWGAGLSVVNGRFTLAADHDDQTPQLTSIEWQQSADGAHDAAGSFAGSLSASADGSTG